MYSFSLNVFFFCDPDLYSIFSARASLRDLEIRAWACDARRRYVCVWKGLASSISTSAVFLLVALNLLEMERRESFEWAIDAFGVPQTPPVAAAPSFPEAFFNFRGFLHNLKLIKILLANTFRCVNVLSLQNNKYR